MNSDNPFSQQYQRNDLRPSKRNSAKKILLVVFGGLFFTCAGLIGLLYFAVQEFVGPASTKLSQLQRPSFESNANAFNDALQQTLDGNDPTSDSTVDPALLSFIEQSLDQSIDGVPIPFNEDVFIEAIGQSDWIQHPLSIVDRLLLHTWFGEYAPEPDSVTQHYRVLSIREEAIPGLAAADIVFYDEDSQAQSYQWYLAKVNGQWTLYDWNRLEFGLRLSDEYAAYLRGNESLQDGSYEALTKAGEAEESAARGDLETAERILRQAERVRVLPAEEQMTQLQIGYTWMSIGDYEEALRVFESIRDPDGQWGVWPCIAVCQYSLRDDKAALDATQKAGRQSPNHPNVLDMLSDLHSGSDEEQLAAASAIKLIRLCPNDAGAMRSVMGFERAEDLDEILSSLTRSNDESLWRYFIGRTAYDSDWAEEVAVAIAKRQDAPAGSLEIVQGNRAEADGDLDLAAAKFLSADQPETEAYLRELAGYRHFNLRSENDQFEKLFAESDDLAALMRDLFEAAMCDELYSDPQKLLGSISSNTNLPDTPCTTGIKAWCQFELAQYGPARKNFEAAIVQINQLDGDSSDDMEPADDDFSFDSQLSSLEYYIAECLLIEGKPVDAFNRFPNDADRHDQITGFLLNADTPDAVDAFIEATDQSTLDRIQLQRRRLMAKRAFQNGDNQACDQHHHDALAMAKDVYDAEESYVVRSMIVDRAKSLVWQRTWKPFFADINCQLDDLDERAVHSTAFAAESARLLDLPLLTRCLQIAENAQLERETLATIQWHLATVYQNIGKLPLAVDAMRSSLDKTDSEDEWLISSREADLAQAYLKLGLFEEAAALLDSNETNIPAQTVIDLAKGDLSAVKKSLVELDQDAAVSWLRNKDNYTRLQQHGRTPDLRELLSAFPLNIRTYSDESFTNLYFDSASSEIDQAFIKRSLQTAWPDRQYTLRVINVDTRSNPSTQAVVAESDSDRVFFSWREDSGYETNELSSDLRSAFAGTVTRLTISIASDQPRSTENLFRLSRAACSSAFAFTWGSDGSIWIGDDLSEQLKWGDQVPTPEKRGTATISLKSDNTYGDNDSTMSTKQWQEKVAQADGKLAAIINLGIASTSEALLVDVVGANRKDGLLYVVPRTDSAIDSVVQSGIRYACWPYQVRLP